MSLNGKLMAYDPRKVGIAVKVGPLWSTRSDTPEEWFGPKGVRGLKMDGE